RSKLDFSYLREHGQNWYPHMLVLGLMGRNIGYLAKPTAIHIWENETFWGIDPYHKEELIKGISNILLALKDKTDTAHFKQLLHAMMINRRFINEKLTSYLPAGEVAALKRRIKSDTFRAAMAQKLRDFRKML